MSYQDIYLLSFAVGIYVLGGFLFHWGFLTTIWTSFYALCLYESFASCSCNSLWWVCLPPLIPHLLFHEYWLYWMTKWPSLMHVKNPIFLRWNCFVLKLAGIAVDTQVENYGRKMQHQMCQRLTRLLLSHVLRQHQTVKHPSFFLLKLLFFQVGWDSCCSSG